MEVQDINNTIEGEVLNSYQQEFDKMGNYELAPLLDDIFQAFYENIFSNMEEIYENVFGDSSKMREDWLLDIGIDPQGIPNILAVCRVLNVLALPYLHDGVLYNYAQGQLLYKEENIYDMEGI